MARSKRTAKKPITTKIRKTMSKLQEEIKKWAQEYDKYQNELDPLKSQKKNDQKRLKEIQDKKWFAFLVSFGFAAFISYQLLTRKVISHNTLMPLTAIIGLGILYIINNIFYRKENLEIKEIRKRHKQYVHPWEKSALFQLFAYILVGILFSFLVFVIYHAVKPPQPYIEAPLSPEHFPGDGSALRWENGEWVPVKK